MEGMSIANILSIASIVFFVLAGICFVLALSFFVSYDIKNVIDDLSGKNIQKSLQKHREANEKTGRKFYESSKENTEDAKLTGTMEHDDQEEETALLEENQDIIDEEATDLLQENKSEELFEEETGLLEEETSLLNEEETALLTEPVTSSVAIKLIEEILYVHTQEEIK